MTNLLDLWPLLAFSLDSSANILLTSHPKGYQQIDYAPVARHTRRQSVMSNNTYSPHHDTLTIVKSLRSGEIAAQHALSGDMSTSVQSHRKRDKLTVGLRSALKAGIPIEELASSTGLTIEQIEQRVSQPVCFDE